MSTPAFDPVTFEVIWHRLLDITEEMGIKYMRTSGSPIVVGGYDASTGISLPDGQIVAIGPYITTQGTVLALIARAVRDQCMKNPGIGRGDMFMCSDPYLGATHQSDVATLAPVFHDGELTAWVGSSGHWLDVGGPEPGSLNMNAYSVFDEGLRLPPFRIVEGGRVREDLVSLIMNNVRDPLSELDLRGQIVANAAGVERLDELYAHYGVPVVHGVMLEAIAHVERRLRGRLRELPDGVWREVQFLDHDGHNPTLHKIVCTVTKRGDQLRIDFTGSDPQADGYINCAWGGVRAATLAAMFIMLAWDLPWNEGVARCVELVAPPGTVCTAIYPAPVSLATISAIIVSVTAVFGALSKMLLASPLHHREAMANWGATSLAPTFAGLNERGIMTVNGETSHFAMGCGARSFSDGVDTGGIIVNTTASIPPIETVEAEFPILYLFRRQTIDSGGAGRYRGGVGAGVAVVPWDAGGPLESAFGGSGAEVPGAYGLAGGMPGGAAKYVRYTATSIPARLASGKPLPADVQELDGKPNVTYLKHSRAPFPHDMVEYHCWQGGGGYGDPLERDPSRVAQDMSARIVSKRVAHEIYGVVLLDGGSVDEEATRTRRESIRRERLSRARPGKEVLSAGGDAGAPPIEIASTPDAGGQVSFGDLLQYDFDSDQIRCLQCREVLGPACGDFRLGCLVEEAPVTRAGPVRGEDYDAGRIHLRLSYCPGCGRQLDAEVALRSGHPPSGFRICGAPDKPTERT
ncbi:MAG TPA: hydantoinase B/oxoprolinase family protein [Burkholderiales bacterium]|nr:hydantoinase B/oxoprolinase family protein [Burkholderiales bacterium]